MMIVTWSSASWKAPRTRNRLWVSSAFRKASHAGKGYRHLPFPSCSRIKPGTRALYRRLLDQRILPVLIFEPIWMRRLGGWSPLSAHRWRPCDGSDVISNAQFDQQLCLGVGRSQLRRTVRVGVH